MMVVTTTTMMMTMEAMRLSCDNRHYVKTFLLSRQIIVMKRLLAFKENGSTEERR